MGRIEILLIKIYDNIFQWKSGNIILLVIPERIASQKNGWYILFYSGNTHDSRYFLSWSIKRLKTQTSLNFRSQNVIFLCKQSIKDT